jgi:hypothetical protein
VGISISATSDASLVDGGTPASAMVVILATNEASCLRLTPYSAGEVKALVTSSDRRSDVKASTTFMVDYKGLMKN